MSSTLCSKCLAAEGVDEEAGVGRGAVFVVRDADDDTALAAATAVARPESHSVDPAVATAVALCAEVDLIWCQSLPGVNVLPRAARPG